MADHAVPEGEERSRPPSNPPTTDREMRGWYMYDFANSPYFNVYSVVIFGPWYKWLAQSMAAQSKGWDDDDMFQCEFDKYTDSKGEYPWRLDMPGIQLKAGAMPSFIAFFKVVVQLLSLLSFAAYGDYGPYRKKILMVLTWIACIFIFLNICVVSPNMLWLASLSHVVAGICFVLVMGYYNAYLPILIENYPLASQDDTQTRDKFTDTASMKGMLAGQAGGLLLQLVVFVLLLLSECDPCKEQCSTFNIFFWPALCMSLVGVWWAGFSAYTFRVLGDRPGPPFPDGQNLLTLGWESAITALRTCCRLKHTGLFVLVYFLASDVLSTITATAGLLNEETNPEKEWTTMKSQMINYLLAQVGGALGIGIFYLIQRFTGAAAKKLLASQIVVMGIVGIIFVTNLNSTIGFIASMAPITIIMISVQSYCRSMFSCLIPPGQESAMFAFYEISDKGSNLMGSLITIFVYQVSGQYRMVYWYVLVGSAVCLYVLYFVDVEEGQKACNAERVAVDAPGETTADAPSNVGETTVGKATGAETGGDESLEPPTA